VALVDRVRDVRPLDFSRVRPWRVEDTIVGWIPHSFAHRLALYPAVFAVTENEVRIAAGLDNFEERSRAVDGAIQALVAAGAIPRYRGESYAVGPSFHARPLLSIDRGAATQFGIRSYGVHCNGYVGSRDDLKIWVARRAADKATWPGKLDHVAAGGQPVGIGLFENLVKECGEEAGIPASLALQARPAGYVSFLTETVEGIDNGTIFSYDLALPEDFMPVAADGEVEWFELWPVARVIDRLSGSDDFVFDSALVVIDFLMRHGFIAPDDPDYVEIGLGLRR
jgi:8-oxo-dGTP pyrophosphatase MutT (NUDIX family)